MSACTCFAERQLRGARPENHLGHKDPEFWVWGGIAGGFGLTFKLVQAIGSCIGLVCSS